MITGAPAQAMGLSDFGISEGANAHLVVLDVSNVREAFRECAPRYVISCGQIV